jgi:predicted NUDIX family phosphoesterase
MEFVYVIPREALFPDFYPHGLVPFGVDDQSDSEALTLGHFESVAEREGFFVERQYAERSPHLKQIIPYGVVVCEDRILLVKRLAQGGEKRLHDKLSIGIGGHINPIDSTSGSGGDGDIKKTDLGLFDAATLRELTEELFIEGPHTTRTVGVLNDDSNPVGAVHVGLVQVVQVRGTVDIREKDVLEGEWVTSDELRERLAAGANFETWSQLLVDQIDSFLPHSLLPPPVVA